MDSDKQGCANFRLLVSVLGLLCGGDITDKLKLLFCLHLPGVVLPGELDSDHHVRNNDGGPEVAADATDFFTPGEEDEGAVSKTESLDLINKWLVQSVESEGASGDVSGETKTEMRRIPPLPQKHFVLLWKTLYSIFLGSNEMPETEAEQAAYHAVSVVGTLLLQIGEVGQKLDKRKSQDENPTESELTIQEKNSDESFRKQTANDWKITFEQFLASILTESTLVDQLSMKTDLEVALQSFATSDFKKNDKRESVETSSKSVFYV